MLKMEPMILPVKPLSQRDPQWSHQPLGFSSSSIGQSGCAITVLAMLLNATRSSRGGRDVVYNVSTESPITVNQELRTFNAYIRENNVNWAAVTAIWPRLRYVGRIDAPNRPLRIPETNQISLRLNQGLPVIAYVDASAREPGLQQHFVLITGDHPESGDYIINDPWYGDLSRLCPRYGETPETAICGLILYDLSRAGNDAASD